MQRSVMIKHVEDEHDHQLRQAAFAHARRLSEQFGERVPLTALKLGFTFQGQRISFGSFFNGIYRAKELHGPSALAIVTVPPTSRKPAPYEDTFDETTNTFTYRFREAKTTTLRALLQAEADNRTLIEAHRRAVPLLYFRGLEPGRYAPLAPAFIASIDTSKRLARLEMGLPLIDTANGMASDEDTRRYATTQAAYRLHQQRFRSAVLRAYRTRCTICSLREAPLLEAAHILDDRHELGHAVVANGLSLCVIHHLAYDRNLVGIDADGRVHLQARLLDEVDGPMLKNGLQHFHGAQIRRPTGADDRPDRERLAMRFEDFQAAA